MVCIVPRMVLTYFVFPVRFFSAFLRCHYYGLAISVTLVMRSSITALREKLEDPERMLHQLILDMDEELCKVRSSVAEAIADEVQMASEPSENKLTCKNGPSGRWSP